MAAWCGIFLADLFSRRQAYAEVDLYDASGRYGSVNPLAVAHHDRGDRDRLGARARLLLRHVLVRRLPARPVGLGGKDGDWAYANIGVLVALVLGFVVQYFGGRSAVRRQESSRE